MKINISGPGARRNSNLTLERPLSAAVDERAYVCVCVCACVFQVFARDSFRKGEIRGKGVNEMRAIGENDKQTPESAFQWGSIWPAFFLLFFKQSRNPLYLRRVCRVCRTRGMGKRTNGFFRGPGCFFRSLAPSPLFTIPYILTRDTCFRIDKYFFPNANDRAVL